MKVNFKVLFPVIIFSSSSISLITAFWWLLEFPFVVLQSSVKSGICLYRNCVLSKSRVWLRSWGTLTGAFMDSYSCFLWLFFFVSQSWNLYPRGFLSEKWGLINKFWKFFIESHVCAWGMESPCKCVWKGSTNILKIKVGCVWGDRHAAMLIWGGYKVKNKFTYLLNKRARDWNQSTVRETDPTTSSLIEEYDCSPRYKDAGKAKRPKGQGGRW